MFLQTPLGQNLTLYKRLHNRLVYSAVNNKIVYGLLRKQPIQKPNSIMCCLFRIYVAHYLLCDKETVKMSDVDLIRLGLI